MRKPFKAGKWLLDAADANCPGGEGWYLERYGIGGADISVRISDADLRHINRITAKALKYRARGKAKPG